MLSGCPGMIVVTKCNLRRTNVIRITIEHFTLGDLWIDKKNFSIENKFAKSVSGRLCRYRLRKKLIAYVQNGGPRPGPSVVTGAQRAAAEG